MRQTVVHSEGQASPCDSHRGRIHYRRQDTSQGVQPLQKHFALQSPRHWSRNLELLIFRRHEKIRSNIRYSKTGFAFSYVEVSYLRLLRGKLSPGQEVAVQHIYHGDEAALPSPRRLRELLLHAIEAYAVAKRAPTCAMQFHVNYPASYATKVGHVLTFPSPEPVSAVSFDGHFGVHRKLSKWDPPRTVKLKGHPRTKKIIRDDERSCSCKRKDAMRVVLPQRTAGWHFAVDPCSRRVLGAMEHVQNECNHDKMVLLKSVLNMKGVRADLLIHDDMCHFEPYAKKHHSETFGGIRFWVIDAFHCPNHKCHRQTWSLAEKRRCKEVRTNVSESWSAWVRALNLFMNGLRPLSHRFWMEEMCVFYNNNLKSVPVRISRRTNVLGRARKILKRPSSKVLRKPSVKVLKRPSKVLRKPSLARKP